jgi:nitrate/nitrite transport system substrate-binding protein
VKAATATTAPGAGASAKKSDVKVRLGFIALTDCAPIIMAKELGYFAERGLDVSVEKQASWAALRDAVLNNQIDGAHSLFGMPFSVASGIGGAGATSLRIAMMLNQNGQAITLDNSFKSAGYGDLEAAGALLKSKTPTLAMTFPGGTHDMWLRYWLAACKVDPATLKIIPIPPPQMVANMKTNNMDGYCVGEPWNAQAVFEKIGFTHLTSQDIWSGHPEKALMVNEKFATERTAALKDVMGAILKASKWLDDPKNRVDVAETLAKPAYVNTQANNIGSRLIGQYDLGGGLGLKEYDADKMQFFQNGTVSFPRRAHAVWFLSQYERFKLVSSAPDYTNLPSKLILSDLYAEVAAIEKVAVPNDDMSPFAVKLDGVTFDPRKPQEEVKRP